FFQAEDGIRDFHVTGVQTCALPISPSQLAREPAGGEEGADGPAEGRGGGEHLRQRGALGRAGGPVAPRLPGHPGGGGGAARPRPDRKSTRLNSSHVKISYAVFCLKK